MVDNAAFTPGSSSGTPAFFEVDDTGTSVASEGSAGIARMTPQRGVHVNLRNNSGSEITTWPVTNAGTFAVQVDGAALTALQLIDNIVGSINGPGAPVIDSYATIPINLAAGNDQVLVSSAANKQIWVYGLAIVVNVAGTVSFQDEDNTAISGVMPFSANSGITNSPSGNFAMPIWKLATDKDLEVDIVTSEVDGWLAYAIVSV